jgi:hypothetical protein
VVLCGIVVFETPESLGGRSYIKAGKILFWFRKSDCTERGNQPEIGDKVYFSPYGFGNENESAQEYAERVFHAGSVVKTCHNYHQQCIGKCAEAHEQGLAFDMASELARRESRWAESAEGYQTEMMKRSQNRPPKNSDS